jgi:hypothetical protein
VDQKSADIPKKIVSAEELANSFSNQFMISIVSDALDLNLVTLKFHQKCRAI